MIRRPGDQDLPQLMLLWQEAFGDSAAETRFYFERRHRHENMLVMEKDAFIAGMLTMLPVNLLCAGMKLQARYVFAVATKREYRSQGISTALLESAHNVIRLENGAASILVPASEDLFSFYGNRGYLTAFFIDQAVLDAVEIEKWHVHGEATDCGADEYQRIRKAAFSGSRLFLEWDLKSISYVKRAAEAGGGRVLHLRDGSGEAAALIEPRDGFTRITELALSGITWQRAMALLHKEIQAEKYLLRLPQGSLDAQKTIPFGMIHWVMDVPEAAGSPAYLSLVKD